MTKERNDKSERPAGELMDAHDVSRGLKRIAHEIAERNRGTENLVIVGIHTRGVALSQRIAENLRAIEGSDVATGTVDVALYRDDFRTHAAKPAPNSAPFIVEGKTVVLVDDVLYTGRTVRAALDALSDYGRPASVQLAVLVDRGHRELPIRADFVGKNLPTSRDEKIVVHVRETDGEDGVRIEKQGSPDSEASS